MTCRRSSTRFTRRHGHYGTRATFSWNLRDPLTNFVLFRPCLASSTPIIEYSVRLPCLSSSSSCSYHVCTAYNWSHAEYRPVACIVLIMMMSHAEMAGRHEMPRDLEWVYRGWWRSLRSNPSDLSPICPFCPPLTTYSTRARLVRVIGRSGCQVLNAWP